MWIKLKDKETSQVYFYNDETLEKTPDRPKDGFRIYHILIKHNESRNPVARTKAEAKTLISKVYEDLKSRINESNFRELFKEKAAEVSECSSSKRGGDLGFICKNEMFKEFENAAFILKRGRIVGPVKTPSGYHIIYRR